MQPCLGATFFLPEVQGYYTGDPEFHLSGALEARAAELEAKSPAGLPLFGIPFAIKDNIDLAGRPTTAACPEFAYTPAVSAAVVQRLLDAGAIALGKTNLDQFATGLVGTRHASPRPRCISATS